MGADSLERGGAASGGGRLFGVVLAAPQPGFDHATGWRVVGDRRATLAHVAIRPAKSPKKNRSSSSASMRCASSFRRESSGPPMRTIFPRNCPRAPRSIRSTECANWKRRERGTNAIKPKKSFTMRIGAPIAADGAVPKKSTRFLDALRDNAMLKRDFPLVRSGRHQMVSAVHWVAADRLFHGRLPAEGNRSRLGERRRRARERSIRTLTNHEEQHTNRKGSQRADGQPDGSPAPPGCSCVCSSPPWCCSSGMAAYTCRWTGKFRKRRGGYRRKSGG